MHIGQKLFGRLGSYTIQEQLYRTIYSAISSVNGEQVIVKTERIPHQLNNEKSILTHFRNKPHIRQLIDEVHNPPALVLNHLDGDILDAAKDRAVLGRDLKYVAKIVLERLADMHSAKPTGLVHTDVKPRNILVNYGHCDASDRFSEVQLADFGDAFPAGATPEIEQASSIGAVLWRSPEAMLGLRWDTPTDIWSYGATLLGLLLGGERHFFSPAVGSVEDPDFQFHVLVKQASHFGPFPAEMMQTANDDARTMMQRAWDTVQESEMHQPFDQVSEDEVPSGVKEFLLHFMKLDPQERPKASDLLRHRWFGDGKRAGLGEL